MSDFDSEMIMIDYEALEDFDEEANEYKNNGNKIVQLWTDGSTKLLLDQYASYLPQIGPLKKFKKKKDMWQQIAKDIGNINWKQCEQRYKTVMKRKKSSVENNMRSGAKRVKIEFEEEIEKINKLDDSIEPEIQLSSKAVLRKCDNNIIEASTSQAAAAAKENKKKTKSAQESLLEMLQLKEEGKERRHREKMEKADRLEKLLLQLIEKP